MYQTIRIPEPCAADWHTMTPEGKGRHCSQCCKTVVDFTQWEHTDILAYLKKHASTGVCGHFRKAQLDIPIPVPEVFVQQVNQSFLSLAQKIAAVFLYVFCIMAASCNNTDQHAGMPVKQHMTSLPANASTQQLSGDTIIRETNSDGRLQGEAVALPDTDSVFANEPVEVLGGAPVIEEPPVIMPLVKDSLSRDTLPE